MKTPSFPVVAFYLAVPLLVLSPSLSPSFALSGGDWTDLIYPFHWFSRTVFQEEGRLPFWNPYIFSGQPHLASLNVLIFYPTELLSLLVPLESPAFYALDLIFHLWAAGTLLFVFLRNCGLSPGASFFGGLAYMLGGHLFSLAGAGHPHVIRCLAWLPLFFLLLKKAEDDGRLIWYALCGGVISLFVLTAAVQLAVYTGVAAVFWVLLAVRGRLRGRLAGLGVLSLTLAGVGAVVLLPGFEHYLNSVRVRPEREFSAGWSLSGWDLLTWLVPGIFGQVSYYCGPHQFRTSTDYFGLLPASFAVLGLVYAPRRVLRWAFLGGAGLVLAFEGGSLTGSLPVFSGFRNSLRWLTFTHLSLSVLAAYGWEYAAAGRKRGVLLAAVLLLSLGTLCGFLAAGKEGVARRLEAADFYRRHAAENLVNPAETRKCIGSALVGGMTAGLASGAAMALVGFSFLPVPACQAVAWTVTALDLLLASRGYFMLSDMKEWRKADPVVGFLERKVPGGAPFRTATDEYFGMPNRRMYWKLEWTWGYHGVPLERYCRFHEAAMESGRVALFSLLNAKYIVSSLGGMEIEPAASFRMPDGGAVTIYENPAVLPRAWLARKVLSCENLQCAIDAMLTPGFSPEYVPLEGLPASMTKFEGGPAGGRIGCLGGRDSISCAVELDGGGVLVLSEIWYPAWKAFVDGRRAPVLKAYGTLRAVRLPPGRHEVWMTYDSIFFKLGLLVSAVTAAALGALVLAWGKAR